MGETVAFPLREEGLVFLSSPPPSSKPVQAGLQLKEKAQMIRDHARKMFGVQAYVGIGSIQPSGDSLGPSCQQAYLALHWAIHQDREVLFHDEIGQRDAVPRDKNKPWPEAKMLVETYLRGSEIEKSIHIDQYIQDVLLHTAERPELVRIHLVSTLSLFAVELERKNLLPPGKIPRFLNDWIVRLDRIRTTHELIDSFKGALRSFADILTDPASAEMEATARDLKLYVVENFRSPLTVERVARKMGISRSTLHRYVRKWLGVGFNDYLRDVRLEEAKRLLRGGRYGVARIAQECGFSSSGYFIRVFKKATGLTPQQYRRGSGG
jgi:AraC-like DNA-binding protein